MRRVKILVLAAVAAGALTTTLGAGSASATVLCSTTSEVCPAAALWQAKTILDWTVPPGGSVELVNTVGESLDTCTIQTKRWEITSFGSSMTTVTGKELDTTWESCTFPTKMLSFPTWEVHTIAGTSNGTITSDAASEKGKFELTVNTVFFGSCIYGVKSGTNIGDITEGSPAILHTNAVLEKFSGSNFACPATSKLAGTLTLTTPVTTLAVVTG